MPPRHGTKKVRTGCKRCKERKVKCDEKRPVCTGCLRYPDACRFADHTSILSSQEHVTRPSESNSIGPEQTRRIALPLQNVAARQETELAQQRDLELYLLHYFQTETIRTLPTWRITYASREVSALRSKLNDECNKLDRSPYSPRTNVRASRFVLSLVLKRSQ